MFKQITKAALMLGFLQLLLISMPVHAQEQRSVESVNQKMFYGLMLSFTESRVDVYFSDIERYAFALDEGNHSFFAPGFGISVIGGVRLGNSFSLRVMPGVSLISRSWDPEGISIPTSPSVDYKVESVVGELPVDVKFHPFRRWKYQPFLTSGLCYSLDFISLRNNSDAGRIQRLNAHDLYYTCGVGMDYDTRYLRLSVELKASFGLIPIRDSGNPADRAEAFYYHNSPTFSIGINIEA